MGFFVALFFVIVVLAVVGGLTYWIDKDADTHDSV